MNFISLFSGIGGFDLGFERAGMTCVAQVENNAHANQILSKHWPTVARYEDVKHVGRINLPANVDVLCGGFPCQDVSVAGKRAGLAGERSGLWFQFHRILTELRPRTVIVENVPGLLSSNDGQDFAVVLGGLTGIIPAVPKKGWRNSGFARGWFYNVAWRVLDAQYFRVAQRRKRVFIIASAGDGRCVQILFERKSGAGHSQPRRTEGQSLAATVSGSTPSRRNGGSDPAAGHFVVEAIDARNSRSNGDLSGTLQAKKSGGYSLNYQNPIALHRLRGFGDYSEDTVAGVLKARDGKDATDLVVTGTLSASGAGTARTGNARNEADMLVIGLSSEMTADIDLIGSLQADSPSGGGHPPMVCVDLQQITSKANRSIPREQTPTLTQNSDPIAFNWAAGVAAGLSAGELSPTIKSQHNGSPAMQNHTGVRRLTPLECERLQGFPDHWTEDLSDSARYQRLGNAVCVPVAEWLGHRIVEAYS